MKRTSSVASASGALALALLACPPPAAAEVLFTFGGTRIMAPPSVTMSSGPIDPPVVFLEQPAVDGTGVYVQIRDVGPYGDLPDGAPEPGCDLLLGDVGLVQSHFAVRVSDDASTIQDLFVLDTPIVGIAMDGVCMDAHPRTVQHPSVDYGPVFGGGGFGLTESEGDGLVIFPGERLLGVRMRASGPGDWDAMRIFTLAPPEAEVNASIECTLEPEPTAGGTSTFTATLSTTNAAPDPQIAIVLPRSLVAMGLPPSCVPGPVGIVACRGSGELPFAVSFQVTAMAPLTSVVRAFGTVAARDPMLEDNRCTIRVGPDAVDASVPLLDGGPSGGGPLPPAVSFRGGGGCVCGVHAKAAAEPLSMLWPFAMALAVRARARSRSGRGERARS